ncbi:MAG: 4-hydroxy-3-methylbut-2-enyl diphosphate reductase [Candidatus Delongbacteria bacterium]|nr:4-hydroxy-3-methylbut-2-enyl diphosphate reductase [Candidatus Delongbacteria bacterium]MBN2835188.1 4-hydroxy-3-methylbut-2-enyl diphosphate reductase [Candidatus Delongbacteria bacterium]
MKINVEIDSKSGVCGGVQRAIKMVESRLKTDTKPVFVNGELLHNRLEMERLIDAGLKVNENVCEVERATIFIRTHGVGKNFIDKAKLCGNEIIDATCPKVRRSQDKVEEFYKSGYQIVIVGKINHPEVIGLLGYCNNEAIVIYSEDDFFKIDLTKKTAILTQTTVAQNQFFDLVEKLKRILPDLLVADTLCSFVENREFELDSFARKYDVIVFIGGNNSSNTKVMYERISKINSRSHLIENPFQIERSWFIDGDKVGVSGSASTPLWQIEEVAEKIKSITN